MSAPIIKGFILHMEHDNSFCISFFDENNVRINIKDDEDKIFFLTTADWPGTLELICFLTGARFKKVSGITGRIERFEIIK